MAHFPKVFTRFINYSIIELGFTLSSNSILMTTSPVKVKFVAKCAHFYSSLLLSTDSHYYPKAFKVQARLTCITSLPYNQSVLHLIFLRENRSFVLKYFPE